jgi:hypothetical protein
MRQDKVSPRFSTGETINIPEELMRAMTWCRLLATAAWVGLSASCGATGVSDDATEAADENVEANEVEQKVGAPNQAWPSGNPWTWVETTCHKTMGYEEVAVDRWGYVLRAGSFTGTIDVAGSTLQAPTGKSAIYVVKSHPLGYPLFAKVVATSPGQGDSNAVYVASIAADSHNNLILTGAYVDSLQAVGMPALTTTTPKQPNLFVLKLNPNGTPLWQKGVSSAAVPGQQDKPEILGYEVAVDASDAIYVQGIFFGEVSLGGAPLVASSPSIAYPTFLLKLDAAGAHRWSKVIRSSDYSEFHGPVVDSVGNLWVAGGFQGKLDLGNGHTMSSNVVQAFVARLNGATGATLFARRYGGQAAVNALAADAAGGVYIAGTNDGTIDLGKGPIGSKDLGNVFLAKLALNGAIQWSKSFDSPFSFFGVTHLSVDSGRHLLALSGYFFGDSVNFGGGELVRSGVRDVFLSAFDLSGKNLWARDFRSLLKGTLPNVGLAAEPTLGDIEETVFDPWGNLYIGATQWPGIGIDAGHGSKSCAGSHSQDELAGSLMRISHLDLPGFAAVPVDHGTEPNTGGVCVSTPSKHTADCNQLASDGCETNLETNRLNCGVCGKSCDGAFCGDGACRDVPLHTIGEETITAVLTDAANIYWATTGYVGAHPGSVLARSTRAGAPTTTKVAIGLDQTGGMAQDAQFLYLADKSEIVRLPKNGSLATPTVLVTNQPGFTNRDVAVDLTDVYWTVEGSELDDGTHKPTGGIFKAAKSGGPAVALVTGIPAPTDLALNGGEVFWTDWQLKTVNRVSKTGIGRTVLASDQRKLALNGMAVDATNVYWMVGSDESMDNSTGPAAVRSIPQGGGPVQTLFSLNNDETVSLALDPGSIFVGMNGGGIWQIPKAGGSAVQVSGAMLAEQLQVEPDAFFWLDVFHGLLKQVR